MTQFPGIARLPIQKIRDAVVLETTDELAVEEPLEIRLEYGPAGGRKEQSISVTMRTPGNDAELAMGFLYTEGIIPDAGAVLKTAAAIPNSICITLHENLSLDLGRLQRHFYTSSSCGVCGKSSLEALRTVCPAPSPASVWQLDPDTIYALPEELRLRQQLFGFTGGLHAAALFTRKGHFLSLREDIGRHNALDKLIGSALLPDALTGPTWPAPDTNTGSALVEAGPTPDNSTGSGWPEKKSALAGAGPAPDNPIGLPLDKHILLLSGRACFELIQKAAMAGIQVIAAVGAPSSLAVELAQEYGITLIGFLRDQRCNIYAGAQRVRI